MVQSQLHAMTGGTASAVVRPAWNDMVLIKRYLDIGAQSLLLPYVQSVDEAKNAVRYTRYPQDGVRGVTSGSANPHREHFARDRPQALHFGHCEGGGRPSGSAIPSPSRE